MQQGVLLIACGHVCRGVTGTTTAGTAAASIGSAHMLIGKSVRIPAQAATGNTAVMLATSVTVVDWQPAL